MKKPLAILEKQDILKGHKKSPRRLLMREGLCMVFQLKKIILF